MQSADVRTLACLQALKGPNRRSSGLKFSCLGYVSSLQNARRAFKSCGSRRCLASMPAPRHGRLRKRPWLRSSAPEDRVGVRELQISFGRCLRPALYSSLRSSPSHPMGVSALRVTIAIASARKQWGFASQAADENIPFRSKK